MREKLLNWRILVIIFVLLNYSCKNECTHLDEHKIHIFYQDNKELKNIKEYIQKYCLPVKCDGKDECFRYLVTIQHVQSEKIDTVIKKPAIPNVGKENNINLNTNKIEEMIKSFDFDSKEVFQTISTDSLKVLYDERIQDQVMVYAYFNNKKLKYFNDSIQNFYTREILMDSVSGRACKGLTSICILWEPIINSKDGKKDIKPQPDTIISPLKDCEIKPQIEKFLVQVSNSQMQTALSSLRILAFNSLNCDKAELTRGELNKLETNKLNKFIKVYGPEYKGVIAALEFDDSRLINEPIGRLKSIGKDVYQVNLLASNDTYSNSSSDYGLPTFKLYTERIHLSDPLKLIINWPKLDGSFEILEVKLRPGSPISKEFKDYIITVSMNSLESDPFVKIELNIKANGTPPPPPPPDIDKVIDLKKDNDGDGIVGYFDINDRDTNAFPKLINVEASLGEKINFNVVNGENLDGVRYDWYFNGVKVPGKNIKVDQVGCFELKVIMTHVGTGLIKELSSEVHGLLPVDVLKKDLDAILRVGQYKAPSRPPTIEVDRADEAEKRIYSYFASGCNEVRNQFNEKKTLADLLNADLRGGAGKIFGINVKSISYKNNGCDKVCSFVYELKQ